MLIKAPGSRRKETFANQRQGFHNVMVLLENIVFPIPLTTPLPVGTLGNVTMEKCVQRNTSLSVPENSTSFVSAGVGQDQHIALTLSSLLCSSPLKWTCPSSATS